MSQISEQFAFSDQLILLTEAEQNNPFIVLEDFFYDNNLPELRSIFSEILQTCLTTDTGPFREAEKRSTLLNLHTKIETVFEAMYIIAKLWASPAEE
jgi:hypothetical protein